MQKLRVGVLMGGKSAEREVSLNSGRTICDHLDTTRYTIMPLFQTVDGSLFLLPWHFLHRGKTADFEHRLATQAQLITWDELPQLIDFMYIAVHGRYAEDGTLQGFLELLRIPYLGSKVYASALGMNKTIQKKILRTHAIDVPHGITIPAHKAANAYAHHAAIMQHLVDANISFPCIVKPEGEGSSLGVTLVNNAQELTSALSTACHVHHGTTQAVLIEEKLEGMEFSCIILTNYKTGELIPLPPTEIVPEAGSSVFDYEQKYMPGRAHKYTPARCSAETIDRIHKTLIKTMRALEITNIARIDGFVTTDNRIVIIDPNTLSGMGPASFLFREAAEINMSHTAVINHLIETELQAYGMLPSVVTHADTHEQIMNTPKMRVAVLMGGASHEKEISLESGRNITYKLSPHHYEAIPLFVSNDMKLYRLDQSHLVRNSTQEIEQLLDPATAIAWNSLPHIADFVFIGLHGGHGENGDIQGTLEMLGLPYNGSSIFASALCIDKFKTNNFLRAEGFAVPRGMLIDHASWLIDKEKIMQKILDTIPLPVIVKPHDDGCSVMVQKSRNEPEISSAIDAIFSQGKQHALIEECIVGMELTVGVIGNDDPRALPPSQAVATRGILSIEEKFLPGAGENQTPAPLPASALQLVQETVKNVFQTIGCKGYARIDCFYQAAHESPTGHERVVILEINTLPGMTPATCLFHQAAEVGIKTMDLITMIIQFGLEEHKKRVTPAALAPDTAQPQAIEQSA